MSLPCLKTYLLLVVGCGKKKPFHIQTGEPFGAFSCRSQASIHGNMTTCFGALNLPWKLTVRPQYWWFPIGISFSRGRFSGGYLSFRVLEVTFLRSLPYNMMLGLGWSINAVVPRQREDSLDQKQDESLGLQWPLSQPTFGAEDDVIDAISNPTCRDTNQMH